MRERKDTEVAEWYLVFLEKIAHTDNVLAVVLGTQLWLHLIHPRFQLIRLAVERQRLWHQQLIDISLQLTMKPPVLVCHTHSVTPKSGTLTLYQPGAFSSCSRLGWPDLYLGGGKNSRWHNTWLREWRYVMPCCKYRYYVTLLPCN